MIQSTPDYNVLRKVYRIIFDQMSTNTVQIAEIMGVTPQQAHRWVKELTQVKLVHGAAEGHSIQCVQTYEHISDKRANALFDEHFAPSLVSPTVIITQAPYTKPVTPVEKQQRATELLAQLASAASPGEKRKIRAALRAAGHYISKQGK